MKYIDIDRLRARIEKDLVFDNSIDTAYYRGRRDARWNILNLIDSLQQEQPDVDLEKEIDRLWESFSEEMSGPHNLFDMYRRLAHYFYELRRNEK